MEIPDSNTLERLYVVEQKSLAEIGRLYGVHKNQVHRWLVRASISTRSRSEGISLAWKGPSEAQRKASVSNVAKARAGRTPESARLQSLAMKGRTPPNKGVPWSDETRAKHAYRQSNEYREVQAVRQRGELGHNWQGGKTSESTLQGWPWRRRRQECYERDRWICQDCGCKCLATRDAKQYPKRKIQAHHLVSRRDGGTDDLSNLITLCMSCHHKREMNFQGVTG